MNGWLILIALAAAVALFRAGRNPWDNRKDRP